MDNLTHSLVGLTISKAGLEKYSPATAIVCILAANAPDIDLVSGLFGDRWTLLHYHRGVTHSILGTFLLALIIPSVLWLGDRMISSWRNQSMTLRFGALLGASLIASATHPLLDWTNNYGVRPLLPWNGEWFYGDLVFIADPFLWLILGATAFLLTSRDKWQLVVWSLAAVILTSLLLYAGAIRGALDHPVIVITLWVSVLTGLAICRNGGYPRRWTKSLAMAALGLVLAYWVGLALVHSWALDGVRREAGVLASDGEKVTRIAAMPTLANPTHWLCIVESDRALYRFELFLLDRSAQAHDLTRFAKPDAAETRVVELAERDRRAKILLGFARFPIGHVVDHDCVTQTLVQFADLRYTEPGRGRGSFSVELPVECPKRP